MRSPENLKGWRFTKDLDDVQKVTRTMNGKRKLSVRRVFHVLSYDLLLNYLEELLELETVYSKPVIVLPQILLNNGFLI